MGFFFFFGFGLLCFVFQKAIQSFYWILSMAVESPEVSNQSPAGYQIRFAGSICKVVCLGLENPSRAALQSNLLEL